MDATSDVTLGELARRMDLLHTDVKELRHVVVEHDDLRQVSIAWERALQAHEALAFQRIDGVETRVSGLEGTVRWVVRTIGAAVIAAIIAAFVVNPFR